jgi:flagellar biosynthesis/type III secretory pathway ATPase
MAIDYFPRLENYLQQDISHSVNFKDSVKALDTLMNAQQQQTVLGVA